MKTWSLAIAGSVLLASAASWGQDNQNKPPAGDAEQTDQSKPVDEGSQPVATIEVKPLESTQPQPSGQPVLDVVTVTAQKRRESLQSVPVSVSAMSSDELAHISFHDVNDLVGYVPSLTVDTNVSPLSTSFRIRNVGKFSAIPSFEPAVGLFIDGAFRARSGLGLGDLVDVSRVEVLKGPQSTLYGKNVSAGVISVETQAPTKFFESMGEVITGNYDLRQYKGFVSGPLMDGLSGRVSAIVTRRGPFMENLVGVDHDDLGTQSVRAQLLFDGIDSLTSRLIVGYVEKDFHPKQGDVFVSDANIKIITDAGGQVTNNNPRDGIVEYDEYNRFTLKATDIIFNNTYDGGDWTLTSISSYDQYDALDYLRDAEQMRLSIALYDDNQAGRTFSQELRVDAPLTERMKVLGGLYYLDSTFEEGDPGRAEFVLEDKIEELGDSIAKYIAGAQMPTPGPPVPLIGVEGDRGDFVARMDTLALGVFTKLDVQLTDDWDAALGLRYSSEKKAGSLVQTYALSNLGCVPPANANFICAVTPQGNDFHKTDTFSAPTGSLQTRYHLTDALMVYGTGSTGFKSGGYSLQNGTAPANLRPYGSEDILNFELGTKAELWDRRVRLNTAVFWTRYKDYQEASYDGLFFVINSAESVLVKGMELDSKLRLTDSITATVGMEFVDSRYEKYTRGQCAYNRKPDNGNGQCNLSGDTLPIGARLRTLTSLQWENPLYSGSVYTRWDYLYNSGANTSSEEDPRFNQPSYGLLNVNLGWRNQTWDVMLSGKNLTDEVLVDQSANANVLTPIDKAVKSPVGSYQNYIRSPRELAITLRVRY